MGKTLILAEKPSVAREIARVLHVSGEGKGFISSPKYIITWAIGHLVGIASPEKQNPVWGGFWSPAQLPMLPEAFMLEALQKTSDQFRVVSRLLNSPEVLDVVNATDAGREGELIFRLIYQLAKCRKPVKRLWASDMTTEGLTKAFSKLADAATKDGLGQAAYARSEADWLVGMNFSRLFTLKCNDKISVGRVQTPVLKMLVDRRREIEAFKPRDYWELEADFEARSGTLPTLWHQPPKYDETKILAREQAAGLAQKLRGKPGTVVDMDKKPGRQKAPLPFDLTTLQREANARFGYPAKRTLELAQALYERHKLLTYPRTDSSHLTTELFAVIGGHVAAAAANFQELAGQVEIRLATEKNFECINNAKVSDHHAIIPTTTPGNRASLSEEEWKVYELVCRRFLAAFLPAASFHTTVIWIDVEGERFRASGKVFVSPGWLAAEPWRRAKDNPLPDVAKGEVLPMQDLRVVAKQTKPPAHYTDASLLLAMETAGKLVDDDELVQALKERGLGTPATRAAIIETVLARGYAQRAQKSLVATDKGVQVIRAIEPLCPSVVSPELTGEWECRLKDIEAGRMTYTDFMAGIRQFVGTGVQVVLGQQNVGYEKKEPDSFGTCPVCKKGQIIESQKGFGCTNWRGENPCKFVIWKSMFVRPTQKVIEELIRNGSTAKTVKVRTREKRVFEVFLRIKGATVEWEFPQ